MQRENEENDKENRYFDIFFLIGILLLAVIIIPRTDTENAKAVISSDYSTIIYKYNIYVPMSADYLPFDVQEIKSTPFEYRIKATVEDENFFLDKLLTNYIAVKEYEGMSFIYLYTDYDDNQSDFYCLQDYKDKIKNN